MQLTDIIEVLETTDAKLVNDYINKLGWVFLQQGTKLNKDTNEMTIYYAIGRTPESSTERWA